jgi:polysaccharide export outer membrane protein
MIVASCGSGQYVWVSDLPAGAFSHPTSGYVVRDGDLVSVRVFNQEALSTRARVRSDGRIALPVIGEVEMRGKSPAAVRAEIEERLKSGGILLVASVTVTVEEFQPILVSVLGEVGKSGTYPFDPHVNIAHVIAAAGGLTEYASRSSIFVVRSGPQPLRVRFRYEDVSRGDPRSASFELHHGDLVVVE